MAKDELIAKTLYEAAKVIPEPCYDVDTGSKSISNRALVLAALGRHSDLKTYCIPMIPRSWCLLSRSLKWVSSWLPRYLFWHFRWGARFSREDNGDTLVVEGGEGSSPYLLRVKSFILTMLELLLTFSPLFALLSILYQRTVLVLLLSLGMLTWSSAPLTEGQWQQYWLFRNRWVPTSGNRPWRSEGGYHPIHHQCFQPIRIFYPPLCYTAKPVMSELTGSQVISQP